MKNSDILQLEKPLYLAVAGNIGVGKSTFIDLVGDALGIVKEKEDVDKNKFLPLFYENKSRWAKTLQTSFLNYRFRQTKNIMKSGKTTIQERFLREDACVFAPNLHKMEHMSSDEFHEYLELFENMSEHIILPDVLIYLKASVPTLMHRIKALRGRDMEVGGVDEDYLYRLESFYDPFIREYPGRVLVIDVENLDIVNNQEDKDHVIQLVRDELIALQIAA